MKKAKKWTMQIVMTDRDRKRIKAAADACGMSISEYSRKLINRDLKRKFGETLETVVMGRPKGSK